MWFWFSKRFLISLILWFLWPPLLFACFCSSLNRCCLLHPGRTGRPSAESYSFCRRESDTVSPLRDLMVSSLVSLMPCLHQIQAFILFHNPSGKQTEPNNLDNCNPLDQGNKKSIKVFHFLRVSFSISIGSSSCLSEPFPQRSYVCLFFYLFRVTAEQPFLIMAKATDLLVRLSYLCHSYSEVGK